jgi:thymidylate synthase
MSVPYDYQYEKELGDILSFGSRQGDRTGTGTSKRFARQMRWWLPNGFPLITTKKVFFRGVVEELLWMLSGSTNNNDLTSKGIHIWDDWAAEDGGLGPIYGKQWRSWECYPDGTGHTPYNVDQISWVINEIKTNPTSRRLVVSAWNVGDLPAMALSPCHCLFQFDVSDGRLNCQLYQRSADMFLGVPFNIASYALLTHMVAQQCDLGVGEFIWTGGDCHVYDNHREQVREQLDRTGESYPTLSLVRAASIFDYRFEDITLSGYNPKGALSAPVAV